MKLNVATFSPDKVESTEGIKETGNFKFAKDAQKMVFSIFTKSLYSNPIGSIVREITSNCFDSHQEAGVDAPVELTLTKENNQHYINFKDVGIGMSYERVTTIFAEYFNSTKRDDPNQIGGYGIGGKTPLAYSESFYLITNFDGKKYVWCIYKGEESPLYDLMSETSTKEHNGTTVKVPINTIDYSKFEYEMYRQLYYFENIIYGGFTSYLTNTYTIYQGKDFIYRGEDYSSRMHICLGRVAYPLDFSALGLNEQDFDVPVALKFNIGDIEVTPSRETIQYTDKTIKAIKKKLEVVKEELKTMMLKQYKNIASLADYYEVKKNFGQLVIDKDKGLTLQLRGVVKPDDLIYPKLADIRIPSTETLTDLLVDVKRMGKKSKKEKVWDEDLDSMGDWSNLYFIENTTRKVRRTQSWLKQQHENYYFVSSSEFIDADFFQNLEELILKNNNAEMIVKVGQDTYAELTAIKNATVSYVNKPTKHTVKQIRQLIEEGLDLIRSRSLVYEKIQVPADFKVLRNNEFGKEMLDRKMYVSVVKSNYHPKRKQTTFRELMSFKGTFIYGLREDERMMKENLDTLNGLGMVKKNDKTDFHGFTTTIQAIIVNKTALPLMKHLKNAVPYGDVYGKFVMKKRDKVMSVLEDRAFVSRYNKLNTLFFNKAITAADSKLKLYTDALKKRYNAASKSEHSYLSNLDFDKMKIDTKKVQVGFEKQFTYIESQMEKNNMIKYVNIPHWEDATKNKDLMKLIDLVYVK